MSKSRPLAISSSLVLYKPDLSMLEQVLLALEVAGQVARDHYALQLDLALVDNSDDVELHGRIANWLESFKSSVPGWNLRLVRSPGNIGYGRGNNLVIGNCESDYHAVVNPDLFVEPDALAESLHFMEGRQDVGLLSPAVFGEDGERHFLCKRNPTLLIMFLRSFSPAWLRSRLSFVVDKFEMRDCDYEKVIHPLEYPTGCFMFFRTEPLKAIGGFDPDFFLHYEDADIGRRMLAVALVVYVPAVRVIHRWARDTHRSLSSKLITVKSGWLYWRKWGGVVGSKFTAYPELSVKVGEGNKVYSEVPLSRNVRTVLVTGANGFIGQVVCEDLVNRGYQVHEAVRRTRDATTPCKGRQFIFDDMNASTDWTSALAGVDSVVHLAARVHQMQEHVADPLEEFRRVNVDLTMNLARQAATAGVRRFVFVSTVKVNGETSPFGQPFTAEDMPCPLDPYARSKLEAELALLSLGSKTVMEIVIIRPVLVYGPGVKANFYEMMRWLAKGIPLPLGALYNQRSMVALDNLVDFTAVCIQHPKAANQAFLVSDGEDLAISDLLKRMTTALGRSTRLLPVPVFILNFVGHLTGKKAVIDRLCESLQVDITKNRILLGWVPPVSVNAALEKVAKQFISK